MGSFSPSASESGMAMRDGPVEERRRSRKGSRQEWPIWRGCLRGRSSYGDRRLVQRTGVEKEKRVSSALSASPFGPRTIQPCMHHDHHDHHHHHDDLYVYVCSAAWPQCPQCPQCPRGQSAASVLPWTADDSSACSQRNEPTVGSERLADIMPRMTGSRYIQIS